MGHSGCNHPFSYGLRGYLLSLDNFLHRALWPSEEEIAEWRIWEGDDHAQLECSSKIHQLSLLQGSETLRSPLKFIDTISGTLFFRTVSIYATRVYSDDTSCIFPKSKYGVSLDLVQDNESSSLGLPGSRVIQDEKSWSRSYLYCCRWDEEVYGKACCILFWTSYCFCLRFDLIVNTHLDWISNNKYSRSFTFIAKQEKTKCYCRDNAVNKW